MRLHNGTADRQSHSAALGLGGKERVKDLLGFFLGQPHAGIGEYGLTRDVLWASVLGTGTRTAAIYLLVPHQNLLLSGVQGMHMGPPPP